MMLRPCAAKLAASIMCLAACSDDATTAGTAEVTSAGTADATSAGTADATSAPTTGGTDPGCVDADEDGHPSAECGGDDCDDADPTIHPDAAEIWIAEPSPPLMTSKGNSAWRDVALGLDGSIYLLYTGDDLRLATLSNGQWTDESVGPQSYEARLAVDSAGAVHVAFKLGALDDAEVHYATDSTGSWVVTPVTSIADGDPPAAFPQIAVDGDDGVHVVFSRSGFGHARVTSGAVLTKEQLAPQGQAGCLVTDAAGMVHLGWKDADNVGFRALMGQAWTDGPSAALPADVSGVLESCELDDDGRPHFAVQQSLTVLTYVIVGASGGVAELLPLELHIDSQMQRAPDGTPHLFATMKNAGYLTIGSTDAFFAANGWQTVMIHETESFVQEPLGLVLIDTAGRLHRFTTAHSTSDLIDQNCDGSVW